MMMMMMMIVNTDDNTNDRNFAGDNRGEAAAEMGLNYCWYMNWNISFLIIDI